MVQPFSCGCCRSIPPLDQGKDLAKLTQCNSQFLDKKCESKHGFHFQIPEIRWNSSPKIRLAAFCRCSAAAAATWGRMGWSQCQILMLRVSLKALPIYQGLAWFHELTIIDYTWPAMHHVLSLCRKICFHMKVSASASSCFAWAALSLSKAWPIHNSGWFKFKHMGHKHTE